MMMITGDGVFPVEWSGPDSLRVVGPFTHLSVTGPLAGRILCGAAEERRLEGHPPFARHALHCSDAQLAHPQICPECLRIWNEAGEPEAGSPEPETEDQP